MLCRVPEVVGLIPAAGMATRLQPFPCSKEVYPVGFARDAKSGLPAPKVAAHWEKFRAAGITKGFPRDEKTEMGYSQLLSRGETWWDSRWPTS